MKKKIVINPQKNQQCKKTKTATNFFFKMENM